ncbi:MAG: tRNA pseudouridine(13) synthase TruD [Pseudomonadota bacterium]
MTDAEPAQVWALDPPRAYPQSPLRAAFRQLPGDFRVVEELSYDLEGDGPHIWCFVEKTNANTGWVANALARAHQVPAREVGYAGRKDRHAVTQQWFSIHAPQADVSSTAQIATDSFRVLHATRHRRKLQRGGLRGNRFVILARDCTGDRDAWRAQLQTVRERGVPNYFGPQRFGRDGANVVRAVQMLRDRPSGRARPKDRGMLFSAARAMVFNHIVGERVRAATWDRCVSGDLLIPNGRHGVFRAADAGPQLESRLRALDVHPSGVLPGVDAMGCDNDAGVIEQRVLNAYPALCEGLSHYRVAGGRRALRLRVDDLETRETEDGIELRFALTRGAFATVVLRELFAPSPQ